jgi:hypothetical protein
MRRDDRISMPPKASPGGGQAITGATTCASTKPESAFDRPATVI